MGSTLLSLNRMTAWSLGIRLVLWMGSMIPKPAPKFLLDALTSVEIVDALEGGSGFTLTFSMQKTMLFDFDMLFAGNLSPDTRVVLGVQIGAWPQQLISGVVTHHQVSVSSVPGESNVTVTGVNLEAVLDRKQRNMRYDATPDWLIVKQLLAPYVLYGLNPLCPGVMVTTTVPNPLKETPWQQGETDLRFIQRLAKENNFVFYIRPSKLIGSEAYWGPETRVSVPQSALTLDLGSADNVVKLNFTYDAESPRSAEGTAFIEGTGVALPVMSLVSPRLPLVWKQAKKLRTVKLKGLTSKSYAKALLDAQVEGMEGADCVTGEGELDTLRYGKILEPGKLVGVRGAGLSYDGYWYVTKVTHAIAKGSYTQKFSIRREGHFALLPWVKP